MLMVVLCSMQLSAQLIYDSLLTEVAARYPQEKIHMQVDKSFYNKGETVWFKAYLFTANTPSKISNTLYAELINEKGNILERKTMPLLQGGAASNFELPDTINSGKLFIRAYTSWMLNFDSSHLYVRPINIASVAVARPTSPVYSLTLFPEGGDMVHDIEARVAFKTNDQQGKPFAVSGIVTDAAGKTITGFKSSHNGMGYFSIAVLAGEQYKAVWKDPAGVQHETMLPNAKRQSAALRVIHEFGSLTYTIKRPQDAPDAFKEFVVMAQMNLEMVYAAKINLKNRTSASAPIPIDSLPDGIMQITVFNSQSLPVAERIVFINNGTYFFPTDLHLVEKDLSPRGKNVLQLDVGGSLKSNLSISITDADLDVTTGSRENIYSQLLLTTDLKGYVYDPAYYFASEEDSVKQQLDLVMMTNGWRRYNWEKILAGKMPEIKHAPDNYLSIQGKVFGLSQSQLTGRMLTGVVQASEKTAKSFLTIPVNKDGSFKVDGLYFFDTVKFFYQFNDDKNKRLTSAATFSFNNGTVKSPLTDKALLSAIHFAPQPPQSVVSKSVRLNQDFLSQKKLDKVKVLETVTVTGKRVSPEEKLDKEYASGAFTSGNSRIFSTEDDPFARSAISILDYLRGKVAGLQITTDGPDGGSISRRGSETAVFMNEMNADISLLQSTPMADVAMIKVFDPPFFGAAGGGAGGAVAVYTKKGSSAGANVQGLDATTLYGYSTYKEFFQPNYETNNTDAKDFRTTLYWNPFLLLDEKNKRVIIPFFNNDTGKRLRVVVEGINDQGKLTREEKYFN